MRFMVLVRANADTEAGKMPSTEMLTAMGAFNEELIASGALVTGDGLHPSANGARITWSGGKPEVSAIPGDPDRLIAGLWIVDMPSQEAVIEMFRKCPPPAFDGEGELEIRKCFEPEDFAETAPPELIARERELRDSGRF